MSILKKGSQLNRNEMKSILGGASSLQVCAVVCTFRLNGILQRGCPEGLQCLTITCTDRPRTGKICDTEFIEEF